MTGLDAEKKREVQREHAAGIEKLLGQLDAILDGKPLKPEHRVAYVDNLLANQARITPEMRANFEQYRISLSENLFHRAAGFTAIGGNTFVPGQRSLGDILANDYIARKLAGDIINPDEARFYGSLHGMSQSMNDLANTLVEAQNRKTMPGVPPLPRGAFPAIPSSKRWVDL